MKKKNINMMTILNLQTGKGASICKVKFHDNVLFDTDVQIHTAGKLEGFYFLPESGSPSFSKPFIRLLFLNFCWASFSKPFLCILFYIFSKPFQCLLFYIVCWVSFSTQSEASQDHAPHQSPLRGSRVVKWI